jgi:hypothetical protein
MYGYIYIIYTHVNNINIYIFFKAAMLGLPGSPIEMIKEYFVITIS